MAWGRLLRKTRAACEASGLAPGTFDMAFGRALSEGCHPTEASAWHEAVASGGIAALDLSFMDGSAVSRGISTGAPSARARGVLEVEMLMKAGVEPALLLSFRHAGGPLAMNESAKSHVESRDMERTLAHGIPKVARSKHL